MKLSLIVVSVAFVALSGCGAATAPSGVTLRVVNDGPVEVRGLVLLFPASRLSFGDVPAGASTGEIPAPAGVYRAAAFEFIANESVTKQPVIDWTGEVPLEGKRFVYVLAMEARSDGSSQVRVKEVRRLE